MKFIFFEFGKYSLSTLIAFCFDVLTLFLLTEIFSFHYMISALLAVSAGFTINYILNIKWVFKNRRFKKNIILEYNLMVLISIGTSLINIILIWILTDLLLIYYILSKFIASIFSFILKFSLKRNFLFSHRV